MEQSISKQELLDVLRGLRSNDERFHFFLSACENHNLKLCQICLESGIDVNVSEQFHKMPIFVKLMATGRLTIEVADWFVENGVDINLTCAKGFSPLTYACYRGDYQFAKYFIEKGAKIREYRTANEASDLYYAVTSNYHNGNIDIVRLLIDAGVELESNIKDPCNPFMAAVQQKRTDIVNLFLEKGANPNFYHYGRTPLHVAVANKDIETARLLLKNGANPNMKAESSAGFIKKYLAITAMDIAIFNEDVEMQKLLSSFCAFPSTKEEKTEILMKCTRNDELRSLLSKVRAM